MEKRKTPRIRFKGFSDDWEQRKLGEVVGITSGFMGDSLLSDGKYHLTRIETIADGIVDENRVGYLNEKPDDMYLLKHGDILYSNINSISHMGKVAKYQGNSPLYHGINLLRLQLENNINSDFLLYLLNTEKCRNWAKTRANQAVSQASINQSLLTTQEIAISSFEEQKKIGDYFRNLDHLITLHQRKLEKLKIIKKSMLENCFPKNGEKVPQIRFSGFTNDWEQRKVGELLIERNEQAPMSIEYPLMAFIANEGVAPKGERYDRSSLVTDTENKLYKRTEFGDFIYSSNNLETGSIGLNKYGKACISSVYSIFQPTGIADSDFLGRRLVRKDFINTMVKWRQGVIYGQWRIHESDFLKIEIPVPSLKEQRKIGIYLEGLDNLITLHQSKLEKLQKIKKALLERMFV